MLPDEPTGGMRLPRSGGEVSLDNEVIDNLRKAARDVSANSYSPYSSFPVGAAVLVSSGTIYSGTNVENSSLGLTICAERAAITAAVTAGERSITALAVYTPTPEPTVPCGACLQVVSEFAEGDIPVIIMSDENERWLTLSRLLPEFFEKKPKEKQ